MCPMRHSPNNYVAEACGVAMQLHLASPLAPLHMVTDSKGVFLVVKEWIKRLNEGGSIPVTERRRFRQGARCFMEATRVALWRRGPGMTWISWQTSHSGATVTTATLLEAADQVANGARRLDIRIPPYTFFEGRLIWHIRSPASGRDHPVLGDVRKAIESQIQLRRLEDWAGLSTQGVLVRKALDLDPREARPILHALKRFRSIRVDALRTFVALTMSSMLPTEHRLARLQYRRARSAGVMTADERGEVAVCRLCRSGEAETMDHVLSCRATRWVRDQSLADVTRLVQTTIPKATSGQTWNRVNTTLQVLLPTRTEGHVEAFGRLFPQTDPTTMRIAREWPRWLLHVGIAPAGLRAKFEDAVARAISPDGDQWHVKAARKRASKTLAAVLTMSRWAGFRLWVTRTRMLRRRWAAPEAAEERARDTGRVALIRHARHARREAKAREAERVRVARRARPRRRAASRARDMIAASAMMLASHDHDSEPAGTALEQGFEPAKRYPLL